MIKKCIKILIHCSCCSYINFENHFCKQDKLIFVKNPTYKLYQVQWCLCGYFFISDFPSSFFLLYQTFALFYARLIGFHTCRMKWVTINLMLSVSTFIEINQKNRWFRETHMPLVETEKKSAKTDICQGQGKWIFNFNVNERDFRVYMYMPNMNSVLYGSKETEIGTHEN